MPLPAPWLSYKTQDGKEYYYNPQTKVTTWTRPTSSGSGKTPPKQNHHKSSSGGSGSSSGASPAPMGGAGRGGLLAQIQKGTSLKKVKTVEKTMFAGPIGTVSDGPAGGASSAPSPAPAPSGGGMGAMMAAIKSGGNLRKTPGAAIQRENSAGSGSSASSGGGGAGGFAEIMRKNREAAARRTSGGSAPPTHNSSSAPSTPRNTASYENGSSGSGSVEAQLTAIESKLDKIMAHLGIS